MHKKLLNNDEDESDEAVDDSDQDLDYTNPENSCEDR